jgi:hypothetical protein
MFLSIIHGFEDVFKNDFCKLDDNSIYKTFFYLELETFKDYIYGTYSDNKEKLEENRGIINFNGLIAYNHVIKHNLLSLALLANEKNEFILKKILNDYDFNKLMKYMDTDVFEKILSKLENEEYKNYEYKKYLPTIRKKFDSYKKLELEKQ